MKLEFASSASIPRRRGDAGRTWIARCVHLVFRVAVIAVVGSATGCSGDDASDRYGSSARVFGGDHYGDGGDDDVDAGPAVVDAGNGSGHDAHAGAIDAPTELGDAEPAADAGPGEPCEGLYDACGICDGDGSTCEGCDGVLGSNAVPDDCGVCGGEGGPCADCAGVVGGDAELDACGECAGDGSTCEGCDGVAYSGVVFDECGLCGGDGSDCSADPAGCDGVIGSGATYDLCGVCGGDNTTCAGCDGVLGSGLRYDVCGECGGYGWSCLGCDGVPGSGLVFDDCGVCGGDGSSCCGISGAFGAFSAFMFDEPQPPACGPAKEYVLSLYIIPADGPRRGLPLLNDGAWVSPASLLGELATSTAIGQAFAQRPAALGGPVVKAPHPIGHVYVHMFTRDPGGANEAAEPGYPKSQTGGSGFSDTWTALRDGAGGAILSVQDDGHMGPVADAQADIDLRKQNDNGFFLLPLPPPWNIAIPNLSLIARVDFVLSKETYEKIRGRIALHESSLTVKWFGMMGEPGKKEGVGCGSFAAMTVVYGGAIARTVLNPAWTRSITFGERTIGKGTYWWGSHIRPRWPKGRINVPYWFFERPASTRVTQWTYDDDRPLYWERALGAAPIKTNQTSLDAYFYEPDKMFKWAFDAYTAARANAAGTTVSLNRVWKNKQAGAGKGAYPYIETDATDSVALRDWDSAVDPYVTDWWGVNKDPKAKGPTISLKTRQRGRFVIAKDQSGGPVTAEAKADGPWEKFKIDIAEPKSNATITLFSHMNYPVTAEGGGGPGSIVVANRRDVGAWERWTLVVLDKVTLQPMPAGTPLTTGSLVALRSSGGRYLGAWDGGGDVLKVDATAIAAWEIFEVTFH